MKRLKIVFLSFLFVVPLFAVDYSEMSTQELIEIMGYVEKKNLHKFEKELKTRIPTMNTKEKKRYENNLKRLKK